MAIDEPVDDEPLDGADGSEPDEAGPDGTGDPWRLRAEVLALLLVAGAVGLIGQYGFTALFYRDVVGQGSGATNSNDVVLPVLAQGGSITSALLLAGALALVLFVPGAVGRWGRIALNAVSVVGVLVATLALLGIEEALRTDAVDSSGLGAQTGGAPGEGYLKVAAFFVWLPSFALSGFAAFTAWRTLNEIAPGPGAAGDPDGSDDVDDPDEPTELPLEPLESEDR